jgi:predicted permease
VIPLGSVWAWGPITVEGRTPPPGEKFINADQRVVGGHYFQAMEIPLRRGRFFDEHDTLDAPRVVVVDEYMASQIWPGEDPIGKRIRRGGIDQTQGTWMTVVGVVGRIKQYSLDADSRIAFYLPHTQAPGRSVNVVVRGRTNLGAVKGEIRALDSDLPLYDVRTMEQRVDGSLATRRFSMTLLAIFAAIALVLASIGVYGVMAYLVNQGTRELGIRMALGATDRGILSLVLRRGMTLAGAGVGIGVVAALAMTRLLSSFLFGVRATDPVTFLAIAAALMIVAAIASLIPARRASRIDPMMSLRSE